MPACSAVRMKISLGVAKHYIALPSPSKYACSKKHYKQFNHPSKI